MSYLEVGGRRFPVSPGDTVIGSDPANAIVLTGITVAPKHAIVRATPDGQVSIYKVDEEVEALVNGVRLGAQPTPLLHGDKVSIGPHELLFGDERRSGSTQFIQVDHDALMAPGLPTSPATPGPAAGGRLISLTDGREYSVRGESLVIGRAAGSDVVLTSRNVSRRHAEIVESPQGYLLVDCSTNGTYVNGKRVEGQHLLSRGDVIRCGEDELRFYADRALDEVAPSEEWDLVGSAGEAGAFGLPEPVSPEPPPGAVHQLRNTMFGMPGVVLPEPPAAEPSKPPPAGKSAPVLASLVARGGPLRGRRFPISVPVVNIGRADYNDIVLPDESVSSTHAKLQRREGIWVLTDLESTNGTQVDGEPLTEETPLAPGARIRFGNVEVLFEPTDDSLPVMEPGGTLLIEKVGSPKPRPQEAEAPPAPAPLAQAAPPPAAPPRLAPEPAASPAPVEHRPSAPADRPTVEGPGPATQPTAATEESSSAVINRAIAILLVLIVIVVLVLVFAG